MTLIPTLSTCMKVRSTFSSLISSHRLITLRNKDSAVWAISTDSTILGVTDTRMKSNFPLSGLAVLQFQVFEEIFEVKVQVQIFLFFYSVFTFYCTQNDCLNLTVSKQNKYESHCAKIFAKIFLSMAHLTKPLANNGFPQNLSQGWVVFPTVFMWFLSWQHLWESVKATPGRSRPELLLIEPLQLKKLSAIFQE